MRLISVLVLAIAVLFISGSAWAQEGGDKTPPKTDVFDDDEDSLDDSDSDDDGWDDEDAEPVFPRIEHKGYYRFRADMFSNLHLGTHFRVGNGPTFGTSSVLPPLTENKVNNDGGAAFGADVVGSGNDETSLASANMRFRYSPTFLISPSFKFAATFDVMDNIVLGSTPDFSPNRPDTPINVFSGSQSPTFQDSIRVKELYGEWKLLGIPLRFGRMKSHWGLGILANGGDKWDDDYGDYNDRVMAALQLYGIYFFGGYDIVSSGPTFKQNDQPFGQAYDLTETDDVQQGFFGIFSRPVQADEILARRERLVKHRKPAFDWGLYTVYRKQQLDLTVDSLLDDTAQYDTLGLQKRDAWAVIPDLWLRFEYRPSYTQKIHLELEATFIYGKIGKVLNEPNDAEEPERTITSWGVAFEGDYTTGGLTIGLDGGAASGDDGEFLTVNDRSNFEQDGVKNKTLNQFKFDRNYHVDQILFREVIGAVTNAWYAKPYIQYDLFDSPDGAIGGRLDILVAGAMEKDAYPGDEMFLGTEFDAKIFVEDTNKFYADLSFGLFIPGKAFDLKEGFIGATSDQAKSADIAWTLQTHIVLMY